MGDRQYGIDPARLSDYAKDIREITENGVQVAIVIGGGNIFRGVAGASNGMDRVQADHMGMLATVINGLALQSALEDEGVPTRLQTAIKINEVAEPFIRRRALRHLEKNRVVIFGGGTGNPYFTTDSAAVLRAIEIEADVILKGTRVDGIYNSDPETNSDATKFDHISFDEVLKQGLKVMDTTAFTLSQENNLPIIVFDMNKSGNLLKVVSGENIGTTITANIAALIANVNAKRAASAHFMFNMLGVIWMLIFMPFFLSTIDGYLSSTSSGSPFASA